MESVILWAGTALFVAVVFVRYFRSFRNQQRLIREAHDEAVSLGVDRPPTQHPIVDEIACIGCGACVDACPEGDVLGVVEGRAVIVNGMRCVGHGLCEDACPVGAIHVDLGDVSGRTDIPVLSEHNATTVPGLYIAGELSGFALIRNAVRQGRDVVRHIASTARAAAAPRGPRVEGTLDLIVVGAGPAGLSAALAAKEAGLSCRVLDQQEPGGTILQYPRRKLVLTQPVDIPLYGRLGNSQYTKEELLEVWNAIPSKFDLDVRLGTRVVGVEKAAAGFEVRTENETHRATHVVLALGRRGTPRRLGVPGEEREKVMYQLVDASSYRDTRILVVGGGDSAVEAAMGLARQPGNHVTLSYRRPKLVRIRKRNAERIEPLLASGTITGLFESQVELIDADFVRVRTSDGTVSVPNDYVLVLAGGQPPFEFMREAGIAFEGDERIAASGAF